MKALKPRHWSVNMTSPNMSAALRGPSGFIRKGPMYLDGGEKKMIPKPTKKTKQKKGTKVSQIRGTYPWWLGCRISTVLYWPPGQNIEGTEKKGEMEGNRMFRSLEDIPFRALWSFKVSSGLPSWLNPSSNCWHESNSASLNRCRYSTTVSVWPEQRACKKTPWGSGLPWTDVI